MPASVSNAADGAQRPEGSPRAYRVLYDGQCEICQAYVSWLRVLDRSGVVDCIPISADILPAIDGRLALDDCLRELHLVTPAGEVRVGWDAITALASLFPSTRLVGILGRVKPFRPLGTAAYRWVARNRYALSKCRGGACRSEKPHQVRKLSGLRVFWSCHSVGYLIRLPLSARAAVLTVIQRLRRFLRTHGKRLDLLDGKLSLLFLNAPMPNAVPLIFGELFTAVVYKGVVLDPGSPKMRRALGRHLKKIPAIQAVVATHAHEEHVGNLNWLANAYGVPLYVGEKTARALQPAPRIPWIRAMVIGQPPSLQPPYHILGDWLEVDGTRFRVLPAPGHCDDHIVLYDPEDRVLLAGDAFMGAYFSTPNPDVDSLMWIDTLEQLAALPIEVLVEGHGHVHSLRSDFPDLEGVVIREDPQAAIQEKLAYLRWLQQQIAAGLEEGLPVCAIEATCFPWGRRLSWESFFNDVTVRLLTGGHFSRRELVRSFCRKPSDTLPTVYSVCLYGGSQNASSGRSDP